MDVIFDIDGTIADRTHRLHFVEGPKKDYDAFTLASVDDMPIEPVASVMRDLTMKVTNHVICCTARMEKYRDLTERWLLKHRLFPERLYMRPDGDNRADNVIKEELLDQIIADGYRPTIVFDDRRRVVDMWRRRGLVCAQVDTGDF
jgi:hypothetical protein